MTTPLVAAACTLGVLVFESVGLSAQQPIRPVPMTPFADGQHSLLNTDLQYQIGDTKFIIVVPAGFVTDFASTPRAIWAVLPPADHYQLAAIVHDFLYWDQGCTREQADDLLRAAMAESRVDRVKRDLIWQAVRRFGESAWVQNASDRSQGLPRVVPAADLAIPALMTWPVYRAQLVVKGIRPAPPPSPPPAYCTAAQFVKF
jgi:uncharacterized protein DUF1353